MITKHKIELCGFDRSGQKFTAIHDVGTDEFRYVWLATNEAVANAAGRYTTIYNTATKEMLSAIALSVLQTLKARNMLVKP